MLNSVGGIVTNIANKSMDALYMRASALANNISNSDTVDYKSKSVDFENQLSSLLSKDLITQKDVDTVNPKLLEDDGTYGVGQNGVDVETQMIELTRNQLQYSYMQRGISDSLGLIQTAASEGR